PVSLRLTPGEQALYDTDGMFGPGVGNRAGGFGAGAPSGGFGTGTTTGGYGGGVPGESLVAVS
ncbi:MAG TPA: hypothetical protein VNP03_03215, partial [Pseudonocardia sp.]|nr:hypothetical protein [Pseudonocardia sp.]